LTTLAIGSKGVATSPKATPFPIPFSQTFDDETAPAPPKIWYDQMGAWEVQKSPYGDVSTRGNVMRQVVPIWPECWGYSCSGPTTYFGPSEFTGDLTFSFDLYLEDHAAFTFDFLNAQNKNTKLQTLTLDTAGTYSLGKSSGKVDFAAKKWHSISIRNTDDWQAVSVDGKQIVNTSLVSSLMGDHSCDDSAFPFDLTGKQALGLQAGPSSATTLEACRQACCDGGSNCEIYQFSSHPSRNPDCWLGKSSSYTDDKVHTYQSRSRVDPNAGQPYHLKVQLSRYIFASIDNFKIQNGDSTDTLIIL
jgi:hypothetical protein